MKKLLSSHPLSQPPTQFVTQLAKFDTAVFRASADLRKILNSSNFFVVASTCYRYDDFSLNFFSLSYFAKE